MVIDFIENQSVWEVLKMQMFCLLMCVCECSTYSIEWKPTFSINLKIPIECFNIWLEQYRCAVSANGHLKWHKNRTRKKKSRIFLSKCDSIKKHYKHMFIIKINAKKNFHREQCEKILYIFCMKNVAGNRYSCNKD